MEVYFEHLINLVYHTYQNILIQKHGNIYPLRSATVKFGGFQLSYNWYGRTRLGKEQVGNLTIYTKEIHLNILFAYCLAGLKNDIPNFTKLFGFRKLINNRSKRTGKIKRLKRTSKRFKLTSNNRINLLKKTL